MFAEIKSKLSKIVKFDRETIVRVCVSLVLGLVSIVFFATHFTGAVFGILLFVLLSFVTIEPRTSRVFVEDIVLPWYVSLFTCYYFQLACIYGHEWFGNPGIFSVHLLYDGRLFFEIPVIFAVFFLLRTCTLSPRISAMLTPLPFMVLMLTNYYVYSFRGHEIVCEDLVSAKTALSVAGEYTYPLEIPVFFMLLPYVLFIL
ncbi:MAG: hypothetical protein K5745_02275, partial [Saccharofermentans sp.]|nr:hypothetical protein [Saccharofermentans sp.]